MKNKKNKITTPGYFIKRLRDNGFIVNRIFDKYGEHDPRRWTVMVNPSNESLWITCYTNKEWFGQVMFEMSDGGCNIPKNLHLNTDSIEVVINYLHEFNINAPVAIASDNK